MTPPSQIALVFDISPEGKLIFGLCGAEAARAVVLYFCVKS